MCIVELIWSRIASEFSVSLHVHDTNQDRINIALVLDRMTLVDAVDLLNTLNNPITSNAGSPVFTSPEFYEKISFHV